MAAYLSGAWLDQPTDPLAEALAPTGATVAIGRIISGAPDGEARFTAVVADGSVSYRAGVDDSVDVTFTDTYANAVAQLRGDLRPNAAFMRGQTKVTGPTGTLLEVLAAGSLPDYEQRRAQALEAAEL